MIVRKINDNEYEFYEIQTITDVDGNDFEIEQLVYKCKYNMIIKERLYLQQTINELEQYINLIET